MLLRPSITPASLKKKHSKLLQGVSIRTIQHRLKNDLGLPCMRAAKNPSDRENEKKRLTFAKNYQHWTPQQWQKVMFSDESTFRLVRGQSKVIRRPINVPTHGTPLRRLSIQMVRWSGVRLVVPTGEVDYISYQKMSQCGDLTISKFFRITCCLFGAFINPHILCMMVPPHTEQNL